MHTHNKIQIGNTQAFRVFGTDSFNTFTGTPIFIQNQNPPTKNEAINLDAFTQGILIFHLNRSNEVVNLLINIDTDGNQTWVPYPLTAGDLEYIAILPVLQTLYWFTSDSDPTPNVPLPIGLLDWTHGLLWWNRPAATVFKMTAYDANSGVQTWTQII